MAEAMEGLCGGAEEVERKHDLLLFRKYDIRPIVPLVSMAPALLLLGIEVDNLKI